MRASSFAARTPLTTRVGRPASGSPRSLPRRQRQDPRSASVGPRVGPMSRALAGPLRHNGSRRTARGSEVQASCGRTSNRARTPRTDPPRRVGMSGSPSPHVDGTWLEVAGIVRHGHSGQYSPAPFPHGRPLPLNVDQMCRGPARSPRQPTAPPPCRTCSTTSGASKALRTDPATRMHA